MAYNEFYETRYGKESNDSPRMLLIKTILPMLRIGSRILDFGCGDGQIAEMISKQNEVIGLEYSRTASKKARERGIKVIISRKPRTPFPNERFDTVLAIEVIEHLVDTGTFFNECNRILSKKGRLLITTPNLACLANRFRLLFGKTPNFMESEFNEKKGLAGHLRIFTIDMLKELAEEHGFRLINHKTTAIYFPSSRTVIPFFGNVFPSLGETIIAEFEKIRN
jgi:cyclopropane fatty-acyl-phospholipid synthase-like methyltransferase